MRVLIIEDEHKLAAVIKRMFTREGFAVDLLYEGEAGLNTALYEEYDLIILDRALPSGIDGMNICRTLRDKGDHTPILLLTAKDQVHERIEGLNAGADDYLVKPFSLDELLARARALLRRPQYSIGEALTLGDLELNISEKTVFRSGRSIYLTAKEFALLEYLMRHQGQIVSKRLLIAHVWDFDADILPNTVESFIGMLRAKIDKPFSMPLIHTVRGFGYRISCKP